MSDMLTHWAVFDDSLRLMRHDDSIAQAFSEACLNEPQIARLGALTRGGGKWMHPLIAHARDVWADPAEHPLVDRRLAWVVGGITHQACDTVAKALLSRHAHSEWNLTHEVLQRNPEVKGREGEVDVDQVQECSAYYDAHVFRKVYLNGAENPFTTNFLAANWGPGTDALAEFIGTKFQHALLSAHTLRPPANEDGHAAFLAWQDEVFKYMQPRYLFPQHWIAAFNHPDPVKMKLYAVETEFWLDNDPIIAVARRLHRGEDVTGAEIRAASADDMNQSTYGQALELSLRYLRNGTAYWEHRADTLVAPNAYRPKWSLETTEAT